MEMGSVVQEVTRYVHTYTYLKVLEKRSKYPQEKSQQEIIRCRAQINNLETKRTIQRINETKSWFFEKINKIDKLLAKLKGRGQYST